MKKTEAVSLLPDGKSVTKSANLVDKQVGSRVRMRRMLLGISQEKLGNALGITFQQVQKYEKGTNRIGASRLQQISKILDVPPSFFFEGTSFSITRGQQQLVDDSAYVVDFLSTAEGLALTRAFARIYNPKVRKRLIELVSEIADDEKLSRESDSDITP